MRLTAILIALLVLSGCAHSDSWTKRDSVLYGITAAVIVADAITTARIKDCRNCEEGNPVVEMFIGLQPTERDTYLYMGTLIVSNYIIGRALPAKWRPYWYGANIAVHGYTVRRNCLLGLCRGDPNGE